MRACATRACEGYATRYSGEAEGGGGSASTPAMRRTNAPNLGGRNTGASGCFGEPSLAQAGCAYSLADWAGRTLCFLSGQVDKSTAPLFRAIPNLPG